MATLLPRGKQQFIDATGAPLVGGKVFHFIPGTSSAKDTYQDSNSTILNSNPIILDGRGEAVIYGTGSYRQLVQDSLGNTIWDQLTADTSSTNNIWGGTSTGSVNAQAVLPGNFSSQSGQTVTFLAGYTNTGALTLNGIPVVKDTGSGPANLTGGEITAGNVVSVIYDQTIGKFHLAVFPVTSGSIADGSITTPKLADGAVTAVKLANTAVTAGSYPSATITVDAQGRLTAASANPVIPSQASNSGKFLSTDGSNPLWATSTGYTQPTTLGAIGTYAFLANNSGTGLLSGATAAGSGLRYSETDNTGSGTPSGTWQLHGIAQVGLASLWLRIS